MASNADESNTPPLVIAIPQGAPPQPPQQAAGTPSGNTTTPSPRLCSYFAQGTCRFGSQCRFSHVLPPAGVTTSQASPHGQPYHQSSGASSPISPSGGGQQRPPPGPLIIQVPPGHPLYAIDVECVATAIQHNARSIAQVAVVDEWGRPVFNVFVKQDQPVLSYITELTGLTKEILDTHGLPLAEALASLRAHIPPNAILIGQNILKDVQWLQLTEGVDYFSLIDIAGLFRIWNPSRGEYTSFSQDHCAKVWMGIEQRPHHNAMEDASIAMSLFNTYRMAQCNPQALYQMQMVTLSAPRIPGFSSRFPVVDGCCMGNRKKCICGAQFY